MYIAYVLIEIMIIVYGKRDLGANPQVYLIRLRYIEKSTPSTCTQFIEYSINGCSFDV